MQTQRIQRNHVQILAEILGICKEPQVKTEIMCQTDTSIRQLQFCLKQLMKQGLLELHHRKKTYVTTEKGLRYLQLYTEIQKD